MDESRNSHEASGEQTSTRVDVRVSRRGLIAKGAAVAAGGVGLAALASTPAEATTGAMQYGTINVAGFDVTTLHSTSSDTTLRLFNVGTGAALAVQSVDSIGIIAMGGKAPIYLGPSGNIGVPSTGQHITGEVFVDALGRHFHCVAVGTPGIWVRPGLNAIAPYRVCDTRSGTGTPYSTGVKLGPGANMLIQIAGAAGVPVLGGATAIVGNLTVTGGTATSYLTAYPANIAAPTASNINFVAGQTIANQITVALDTNGGIRIRNKAGSVHVILDLAGFFF